MQVDQEEGGHQKCHAEHTPEEEIDHTGTKTKVTFTISVVVPFWDWYFELMYLLYNACF